jgi:lipopolysaccharide transport system ATP-binding protein
MSSDIAIKVNHLSKCYHIYHQPRDRLLQILARGRKQFYREFWALKEVSFEIKRGETFGVIGRNGSGKSTLLQLICGTLNPTFGNIEVNGRVAALLELGAGFNPEFTGRENVYINASIFGLPEAEIDAKLDEIMTFADIGDFIDQPVKNYSSGMYVRLAFAVIAHVNADILIIDEALAVGDVFFQQKCMRFLRNFRDNGGSLLFVSHDMSSVASLCETTLLLSPHTEPKMIVGPAEEVCKLYLNQIYDDPARRKSVESARKTFEICDDEARAVSKKLLRGDAQTENIYAISSFRLDADTFGERAAEILDAGFISQTGERLNSIRGGEIVCFFVRVKAHKSIIWPAVGFMLKDRLGQYLFTEGTDMPFRKHRLAFSAGDIVDVIFSFRMPILACGVYTMNVAVAEGLGSDHVQQHWVHDALRIESLSSRLVHGIGGMLDLDITMQWVRDSSSGMLK